jgi:hypothetical protein
MDHGDQDVEDETDRRDQECKAGEPEADRQGSCGASIDGFPFAFAGCPRRRRLGNRGDRTKNDGRGGFRRERQSCHRSALLATGPAAGEAFFNLE